VINKLDLLTNATVVDDTMRFITEQSKEKLISKQERSKESKESDYIQERTKARRKDKNYNRDF
jgi:hypothetical protein